MSQFYILVKVKAGENFNRRRHEVSALGVNTLSILRIKYISMPLLLLFAGFLIADGISQYRLVSLLPYNGRPQEAP